jgi:hypothetical protein
MKALKEAKPRSVARSGLLKKEAEYSPSRARHAVFFDLTVWKNTGTWEAVDEGKPDR